MNILFVSSSVGPLGAGVAGGVELTMRNAALALRRRDHRVTVIAPVGSSLEYARLVAVPGKPQPAAQHQSRTAPIIMPEDAALANMWEIAGRSQAEYNLILNFAYDWLPFYLTPFFQIPIAHLVSMASMLDHMDAIIERVAVAFPSSVAMHTRAQAQTFSFADRCRIIGGGLDLDLYPFNAAPEPRLCWIGRIAPEKGLEDALVAAERAKLPLDVLGIIEDQNYWDRLNREHPNAPMHYHGFKQTPELARILGRSRALLMTPKWTEAFGNVVIEALACGVPVISYRRGGPAELILDGVTGLLVEPDDVTGLLEAIGRVDSLDRLACRQWAERECSLESFGARLEDWCAKLSVRGADIEAQAAERSIP